MTEKLHLTVLIVSDDENYSALLQEMLLAIPAVSFSVDCFNLSQETLGILATHCFDVCLLDSALDEKTGLAFVEKAVQLGCFTPFILLSNQDSNTLFVKKQALLRNDFEQGTQAFQRGAADCLEKDTLSCQLLCRAILYATERSQTYKQLKQDHNRLQLILDNNADAIIIVDNQGIIQFANPAAESIFNQNKPSLIGYPFGFPALDRQKAEIDLCLSGREVRVAEMRSVQMNWEGELSYLVSIRDITERKRAEQEKEAFIAALAHDLKTPLKASQQVLRYLKNGFYGEINEQQNKALDEVFHAQQFLSHLVENLLTNYKLQANQLVLSRAMVQVKPFIKDVLNGELASFIAKKRHKVLTIFAPDLPPVCLDPFQICRVLYNLIQNAVEYTPYDGEITLRVNQNDSSVVISIEDNGPGISESDMALLFQPYTTMGKDIRHKGTGLGLFLSKNIVALHGGDLTVSSVLGQGACFSFSLPLGSGSNQSETQQVNTSLMHSIG
ncbi:MAG: ATP-binding protein [Cyanobacteria bacterium P01_H01_bin.74]